ncbi:MAG: transglycosylase domain-containing protein [Coriobacteriia bacterium]|nr:transglycosylase domain-containing protein [Coriobacteriia bacterium]MCL2750752.1 transglycosylase domain-containing protein [Coriobacteriia bacterium]
MASRKKRKKAGQKKPIVPFVILVFFISLLFLLGIGATSALAVVDKWLEDVPPISNFEEYNNAEKTKVYANDGVTLIGSFYFYDREPVQPHQVSQYLFNAIIAVEDERYWQHSGVDFYAIARAAVNDILGGSTQGASTITQQLVRQTVLQAEANDITLERKVREIYLAIELEKLYSKETVLMMYLNTINFGDGAYGIQSAAMHYFTKNASELNLAEAALLAGIPQQPTYNNPVYYPQNALDRRNAVLDRMYVNGYITLEECEEAQATPIELNINYTPDDGIYLVPYFTSYVRNVLERQYSTNTVFGSGLTVVTTIDLGLQAWAEYVCAEREAGIDWDVEMGLTTVDPRNGHILAMRGGKDFYTDQWSSSSDMSRQPGSSFKTFGMIAALEQGFSPGTPVSGSATIEYEGWRVANYGNANLGNLTLQSATWMSSNTAFVRVVRAVGPSAIIDVAHRCGITSDLAPVNSVVLGSQGVNTLEMASAYGTIGNNGVFVEPTAITLILDSNGNVIYEHEPVGVQALTPEIAHAATNVLRGVITSGTAHRAVVVGHDAGGKTGISEDYRDAWFVGFTPQLATAMWLGCREERNTGYTAEDWVCPFWGMYMSGAMDGREYVPFPVAGPPLYNSAATFMTPGEKEAADAEAERKRKEEEEEREREEAEKPRDPEVPKEPTDPTPGPTPDPGGTTPPSPIGPGSLCYATMRE